MLLDELPRIVLKPRRAQPFHARHPWVFAGAIHQQPGQLEPGQEVLVVTHEGQPIARGLFNPASQIRVRLYQWDVERALDADFWRERLTSAISLRRRLFSPEEARYCRLVFSEGDGLSGLIIDQFGDWLSVQFTSLAMALRADIFCDLLQELLQPTGIWLRTEKGMTAAEGLTMRDGPLRGPETPPPLDILENELAYRVDLVTGQKTGFYYDQRENRRVAARYLSGNVLDVCCYSGGFALNALRHGQAERVTAVDSSHAALELACENAERNGLAERCQFEQADALKFLQQTEETYDGIVLDPPKFARSRGGLERAAQAYRRWNSLALARLNPGGMLVTCSCSGLVSQQDFLEILAVAARDANKTLRILEQRGQAPDHPVSTSCLESSYLKCVICTLE